jgi:hypothetical protein
VKTTSESAGKRETVVLACRVSKNFAKLVKEYCNLDMHLNPADLFRDAMREKIQRDAPDFYQRLFQEAPTQ